MIYGQAITFGGGGGKSVIPEFTYTGDWEAIQEDDINWKIRLLSSGVLTFKKANSFFGVECPHLSFFWESPLYFPREGRDE